MVIEPQSGAAFTQLRYFIITPDQNMDSADRQAFAKISIDQEDVFTEGIPANMRTGLEVLTGGKCRDYAGDDPEVIQLQDPR